MSKVVSMGDFRPEKILKLLTCPNCEEQTFSISVSEANEAQYHCMYCPTIVLIDWTIESNITAIKPGKKE